MLTCLQIRQRASRCCQSFLPCRIHGRLTSWLRGTGSMEWSHGALDLSSLNHWHFVSCLNLVFQKIDVLFLTMGCFQGKTHSSPSWSSITIAWIRGTSRNAAMMLCSAMKKCTRRSCSLVHICFFFGCFRQQAVL